MRKMKFLLATAMVVIVSAASAQVNLGVKGGVNMSNFYGKDLKGKNAKIGFHIGLMVDYEITYADAIQTGLFFTTKGSKYKGSIGDVSTSLTANPMYLQLPVHYAYKFDVSPGTRVVLHAGPYAAYGVAGKLKAKISSGDNSIGGDGVNIFGKDGMLKPFDAGLGLGVGAELGTIIVDLGWDMGLVNISNISNGNIKNQNAYLSVGYKF